MGMRLSKILINRAYASGYEDFVRSYINLQERAQYRQDAQTANQAYLTGKTPEWQ